jgi:hypothetical protein
MKGSQLKFLAGVADLARLDFEAASVTLCKQGNLLISRYQGAYSSGQRWLDLPDAPEVLRTASAMQFKSLAGLFEDDEELDIIVQERSIRLQSEVKKIDLTTRGEPLGLTPFEPTQPYLEGTVAVILSEVACASEFSARSMAKPVLTGLRIAGAKGQLGVQASDGVSVLFETKIEVKGDDKIDMIAPGYDLVLGLRLLDSGVVKVVQTNNRIQLYGENGTFDSSLLTGNWPDFTAVRAPQRRQTVILPTALIKSLVQSVRILGSSNDLRLRGDGEYLHLETVEAEAGHFDARVPSQVSGTYTFDVGSFLLAQGLGSELTIQLPNEGGVPTLIESGPRRLWLAAKL